MSDSDRAHATLRLTVDMAILTVRDASLQVLLIERGRKPFLGQLALPGGFVRQWEDPDQAAVRELAEETGLGSAGLHLEQFAVFGAPDRDPRGRVVTVAYLAIAPNLPVPVAGSDAGAARWEKVAAVAAEPARLAFDHHAILLASVERARSKLEYTTLATAFCGDTFTIGELRTVYEVVWGIPLDHRNFNRKVTRTDGFIVPVGAKRSLGTGRPAELYRRGPATMLHPPMLRVGTGSLPDRADP